MTERMDHRSDRGAQVHEPIPLVSLSPEPDAPWDLSRAWTLRRRAGFAATWNELQRDLADGPETAISRVLSGTCRTEGIPAEFATTADLLGDAASAPATPTGSKPGGCTGCSSPPTR